MLDWASRILGQITHCREENSSQMHREGGWAVLELPGTLRKGKAVMLSQERIVNKILTVRLNELRPSRQKQ